MNRRAWILLAVLASLWGTSYLFIKIGLRDLSPSVVVLARIALAAAVLVPIAAVRGGLGALRGAIGVVLLVAAVQVAAPFLLIAFGEQAITSSLTGILVASAPLFTAVLAVPLDDEERSSGWSLVGVVAGFVGVALLIGFDVGGRDALLGSAAVLLAALGYAVGGFVVKRSSATVDPLVLAAGTMVAATAMVAPPALATLPDAVPSAGSLAAMAALGVACTGVGFAIFHTLIADVGPARAMLVSYVAPAFAVLYGATLLGEPVTAAAIVGLALIVGGSWLGAGGRAPRDDAAEPELMPAAATRRGTGRSEGARQAA